MGDKTALFFLLGGGAVDELGDEEMDILPPLPHTLLTDGPFLGSGLGESTEL